MSNRICLFLMVLTVVLLGSSIMVAFEYFHHSLEVFGKCFVIKAIGRNRTSCFNVVEVCSWIGDKRRMKLFLRIVYLRWIYKQFN